MAVPPHWLGEPPAEQAPLTGWALSRLASAVAEDVRQDAVVDVTSTVDPDTGVLLRAEATASGHSVFRHTVTGVRTQAGR